MELETGLLLDCIHSGATQEGLESHEIAVINGHIWRHHQRSDHDESVDFI